MRFSKRSAIWVFLFFIGIVSSACSSQATAKPSTQTPQSTKQATPETNNIANADIPATEGSYSKFTVTVKPTGTATSLLNPSVTHTPTVSKQTTPTKNAHAILTEQAIALKETKIASFSPTCDEANTYYTPISPKGNWLAISCGYKRKQTLQVYSKTGQKWVIQFKDYVSKEFLRDGETPMGTLYPVKWTNDDKYLYFRSAIGFSGGGTCFYGGFGQGLYRLNLENGSVSATLAPLTGPDEYLISFSPNGRWLAYNTGVPTIFNLQTGEKIVLQEGRNSVGDFAWSPDSANLIYGTCQPSEDFSTSEKSSIRIFSLETREAKTILETDTGFLRIELIDIGEGSQLKIYDEYSYNRPGYLYFDWSYGQVITPTVTPRS